jgi:hypothetical protein
VTAQNRDANTEAILLVAILERSRVLDYALPKMHEELFLPPFKEVFKRITYLISQGKAPASTRTMAEIPLLAKLLKQLCCPAFVGTSPKLTSSLRPT